MFVFPWCMTLYTVPPQRFIKSGCQYFFWPPRHPLTMSFTFSTPASLSTGRTFNNSTASWL